MLTVDRAADRPVDDVSLTDVHEVDSVYWFDDCEPLMVGKTVDQWRLIQRRLSQAIRTIHICATGAAAVSGDEQRYAHWQARLLT
jgi:hypothetical protein